MLADPKALQYVLQTSGYRFPKSASTRGEIRMIFGNGILWVHGMCHVYSPKGTSTNPCIGEQHHRQRKIMNPAFSVPQLKSFLPLFLGYAEKVRLTLCETCGTDVQSSSARTEVEGRGDYAGERCR